MVTAEITVKNGGFHFRPAGEFANEMSRFSSEIIIEHNGENADGKSVTGILALNIADGASVRVRCSGADENEMLKKAVALIAGGFFA